MAPCLLLASLFLLVALAQSTDVVGRDKSFCLVSDASFHVNALLQRYSHQPANEGRVTRSWIKELGILWKGHSLRLQARTGKSSDRGSGYLSGADLDGTPMWVPARAGNTFVVGDMTLTFLGLGQAGGVEVEKYQLQIENVLDVSFALSPALRQMQSPEDAGVHFSLLFNKVKASGSVQGALGKAYQSEPGMEYVQVKHSLLSRLTGAGAGSSREESPADAADDYVSTQLLEPDCKVSAFVKEAVQSDDETIVF